MTQHESTDDRDLVRTHVLALAADLRHYLEWAELTGTLEFELADELSLPPLVGSVASLQRTNPSAPSPSEEVLRPPVPSLQTSMAKSSVASPVRTRPSNEAPDEHQRALLRLREDLGDCQRCKLHQGRRNLVFGIGNPNARLMLIGEAPGHQEDLTGEPFVGRAGQLLTRMLAAIGLTREAVYICNVVKCRPPDNRNPEHDEIAQCSPFMARQIEAVQPQAIMTLGRFAANAVLGVDTPVGALRGQVGSWRRIPVVPSWHPAYLLRTPSKKRETWEDLLMVRQLLREEAR